MRIIIAGSRTFNDYELLCSIVNNIHNNISFISIVASGAAKGADSLGEQWANEHNIPVKKFKPDWNT